MFIFCSFLGLTKKHWYPIFTANAFLLPFTVMHSPNNVLSAAETPTSDQQCSDETAVSVNGADK